MGIGALIPLAGSAFVASLLGIPHCFAMCGGFVCFYSGAGSGPTGRAHLSYHLGRLASYAALGALAGALGVGLDHLGAAAGVQRAAAIVSGFALIVWGGLGLVRARGVRIGPPRLGMHGRSPIARALAAVRTWPAPARALALGLVTTLLPCGWLYLFVGTAAGTGSVLAGAVIMAAFWAGTVPILAGIGLVAQRAIAPLRAKLPALSAAALVLAGLLTITGKFHLAAAGGAACPMPGGRSMAMPLVRVPAPGPATPARPGAAANGDGAR